MWRALSSYVWWTHPRGSLQYDVMVTLILAFIFISPHYINYRDAPTTRPPYSGHSAADFDSYLIPADASPTGAPIDQASLRKALPPNAGSAQIDRYEALKDARGNIAAYRVWVKH